MKIININNGWKFFKGKADLENLAEASFEGINLPHTWNNLDGQDGGKDYYRGVCLYQKTIDLNKKDEKEYYIEFRGVNEIAKVYVNNEFVGEHLGGFSTFRFNLTKFLNSGLNEIAVLVDNQEYDTVYPQTADFTFFGGIYRDVNFIETNVSRFDLDYFGSEGIMVTPTLAKEEGVAKVEAFLTNAKKGQRLVYTLSKDQEVLETKEVIVPETSVSFTVNNPLLWNGIKEPHLYTMNVQLFDGEELLDERTTRFGFRTFKVDSTGFYLNGKKYPLHGVSRHQDRLNKGWAISKEDHKEDMELIKEMGTNSIRLAHYQHDQYFYDLCDEEGMVIWAEIPYISAHMAHGDDNAISQMKELVIQNYNHASILFWGLSNEITIGGESDAQYNLHIALNKLVKELDPNRLTTMACVTMCDTHSRLLDIPDIYSYNHYFGWYMGETKDNATWLDDFHKEFPDRACGLSEYGCEANLKIHAGNCRCGDYSEEYQALYHETMLEIFNERPWLWSTYCWNMFDFAVDSRDEGGVKGRNNKGLITYDRKTKKDSFYAYKAWWSDEPFIHITAKRFVKRFGKNMQLKVYTNQNEVSLYRGKKLIETKKGEHVFTFEVPLKLLGAKWRVVSGNLEDTAKFQRVLVPHMAYRLPTPKVVTNWFEKDGVKYEFLFPEGKFSIKDKFNTIYSTPEGKKVLDDMCREALKAIDPNADPDAFLKNARKLVGGMTITRIAGLAQDKISQEMLYKVNTLLNEIDKPNGK